MPGLEVTASAFAVVSLAIQMGESVRKVYRFWNSIQNAPVEVSRIRDDLRILETILVSVAEAHQYASLQAISSQSAAGRGLDVCSLKVQHLCDVVERLQAGFAAGRHQRCWAMLKSAWCKRAIAETLDDLESAKATLLLTNQCLFHQTQHHEIRLLFDAVSRLRGPSTSVEVILPKDISKIAPAVPKANISPGNSTVVAQAPTRKVKDGELKLRKDRTRSTDKRRLRSSETVYSSRMLGAFTYRLVVTQHKYRDRRLIPAGICDDDDDHSEFDKTFIFVLPFWYHGIAIQMSTLYGKWTRTLRFSPVVPRNAPIFWHCRSGDIEGIKGLFKEGLASPLDMACSGHTPLHEAAAHGQAGVCQFLLKLGADASAVATNRPDKGLTPLLSLAKSSYLFDDTSSSSLVDIVRALVQTGHCDPMAETGYGSTFFHLYQGPADAYRWMLHQDDSPLQLEHYSLSGRTPVTAQAEQCNSSSPELLQMLLSLGADPQAGVGTVHLWYTPLHFAAKRSFMPRWIVLDQSGADEKSCQACSLTFSSRGYTGIIGLDLNEICYKRHRGPVHEDTFKLRHKGSWHTCPRLKRWRENWCLYITLLIRSGCDVHAQAPDGATPLDQLVKYGRMQELKLWLETLANLGFNMHDYGRREQELHTADYVVAHAGPWDGRLGPFDMRRIRFRYGKTTNDLKIWAELVPLWGWLQQEPYSLADFFRLGEDRLLDDRESAIPDDERRAQEISQAVYSWILVWLKVRTAVMESIASPRMTLALLSCCLAVYAGLYSWLWI